MFTDEMQNPLRIIVLSGGASAERDVSLESGRNVASALMERGHRVELIDPRETPLDTISADTHIILPMLHGTGGEDDPEPTDAAVCEAGGGFEDRGGTAL